MPIPSPVSPAGPIHHDNFMWDKTKAIEALESDEPDILFICGSSRNRDDFLPYFSEIFNLKIDDETMMRRLADRTNNDFGKKTGRSSTYVGTQPERRKTSRSDRY
jgi:hypothetical protein